MRSSVTENIKLKLVALAISLVLFTFVRFQEKVERGVDFEVNVVVPSESQGLIVTSELPDTVRVTLRGRQTVLEGIRNRQVRVVEMDLRKRPLGASTYFFERENFEFPGVEFVAVKPEAVLVRVEKRANRRIPLRVKTMGELKNGVQMVGLPKVEPSVITISGAKSLVRAITTLETSEVDLEGLNAGEHDFTVSVPPIDGISFLNAGNMEATVHLSLVWTPGQRVLSGLLVRVKDSEQDAVIVRPAEVSVSLMGPQVALERLDPGLVVPQISLKEEDEDHRGVYHAKVEVTGLPDDIKVKSVAPATVLVRSSAAAAKGAPPE